GVVLLVGSVTAAFVLNALSFLFIAAILWTLPPSRALRGVPSPSAAAAEVEEMEAGAPAGAAAMPMTPVLEAAGPAAPMGAGAHGGPRGAGGTGDGARPRRRHPPDRRRAGSGRQPPEARRVAAGRPRGHHARRRLPWGRHPGHHGHPRHRRPARRRAGQRLS